MFFVNYVPGVVTVKLCQSEVITLIVCVATVVVTDRLCSVPVFLERPCGRSRVPVCLSAHEARLRSLLILASSPSQARCSQALFKDLYPGGPKVLTTNGLTRRRCVAG